MLTEVTREGWTQGWHGYWREDATTRSEVSAISKLEINCFQTAIKSISKRGLQHIDLLELGCGWGEWCLALAGVVNNRIIETSLMSYRAIGIEGEPKYVEIANRHFRQDSNINAFVLNYAVSDKIGECMFNEFTGEKTYYCQGMTNGNFGGSRIKTAALAAYHMLLGKTRTVPMTTVDELVATYRLRNILVHCDVQGVEDRVVSGAMLSLEHIDYWIIGTHHRRLNEKLLGMLDLDYVCVVDKWPETQKQNGLCQDGLQFYVRKGISI